MKPLRGSEVFLTRDDLKHTVLLHVGGKVPSSHVLLHYAHVGQLLMEENTGRSAKIGKVDCRLRKSGGDVNKVGNV